MASSTRFRSRPVVWFGDLIGNNPDVLQGGFFKGFRFISDDGKGVLLHLKNPRESNKHVEAPKLLIPFFLDAAGTAGQVVTISIEAKYVEALAEEVTKASDETITRSITITAALNVQGRLLDLEFPLNESLVNDADWLTFRLFRPVDTFSEAIGVGSHGEFLFVEGR